MMNVKMRLCSLLRMMMPCVGFALICMGAYLLSLEAGYVDSEALVLAYVLVTLGFLAIFVGVIWSVYHRMKSKMYRRRRLQHNIQVYTIDSNVRRPSSFPPSYEESQWSHQSPHPVQELVLDDVQVVLSLAPPLYSKDSNPSPDCTWSWEQPPPYSLHPEERSEASSGMCG
ncbi:transmembrane protein 252-like [Dunckerocampus dactyliophorus]|uniref:transmembrane protein 252-like n=1 Tax=Dunckerocampus dactyliophorus TaxID=161453 RepID=UPI002406A53F|nr:transmembrane protein 252-like [Dunckerocampus dactyliophorus]